MNYSVAKIEIITDKGTFTFKEYASVVDFEKNNWKLFNEMSYVLHESWEDGTNKKRVYEGVNGFSLLHENMEYYLEQKKAEALAFNSLLQEIENFQKELSHKHFKKIILNQEEFPTLYPIWSKWKDEDADYFMTAVFDGLFEHDYNKITA